MKILAIETSCDDTSLAIFEDDKLLSMSTKSQIKIHNITGGVVPEVAAREHANSIFEVLKETLNSSNTSLIDIDYIGITTNPGLIPSLLTGITVAKTLGNIFKKPIIEINHIEAHIFSNYLERKEKDIKYPLVCLTVSGGHNDIYYMKDMWSMEKIGTSNDDAAGESYDKVAKMMGLSYPGGPIISELAGEYETSLEKKSISEKLFPRVWLEKNEGNFSFSGLKSAVKREIDKRIINNIGDDSLLNELKDLKEKNEILLTLEDKKEISYEFQNAVNEVLSYKLVNIGLNKGVKTIMLAGGVSANNDLKEKISLQAKKNNLEFLYPLKNIYSMDNAAMVGILTFYKIKSGKN